MFGSEPTYPTGQIAHEPPTIGLVLGKRRRTKDGILENGTFSVNLPDREMIVETDWCGLRSGYEEDKSKVFEVSYGGLGSAPLIDRSPVSMECRLSQMIEMEGVDLVIGTIEEVYVDRSVVSSGRADPVKVDPLILWMPGGPYLSIGENLGEAYKVGKGYRRATRD